MFASFSAARRLKARRTSRPGTGPLFFFLFSALLALSGQCLGLDWGANLPTIAPGVGYTNYHLDGPWSIHVVRIDRTDASLGIHSFHAHGHAIGLGTLSEQIRRISPTVGAPVAGINGDFYQRDRNCAGDPRGLQIIEGELVSGSTGRVALWIDGDGEPHATNVTTQFHITWPDGSRSPFDVDGERQAGRLQLYTPSFGPSTLTAGGRELILEPEKGSAWLPLQIGTNYTAHIKEIATAGDTPIEPGTMVLSLAGSAARNQQALEPGAIIKLSTASLPNLYGARTAIGGGPMIVVGGKRQRIEPEGESYEFTSMLERHPRTGIGWNKQAFFLVEVDGRQPRLSVGMTLEELGAFFVKLGCTEAMNLDGGGSATLWAGGRVRNSPCDGRERMIANSVVALRAPPKADAK